uniref:RWD domain-containing protein 1 n=1 Tax=Macaca nemestrina TaxID=9545 RepID=A0A2K6CGG6_MACNE
MTDYAQESIYPDSFMVLSENPPSFTITVTSEAGENDETVQTTLKFTYSEKYPDEVPLYEIFPPENLEENDVSDILRLLAVQAEENLGMVMIFTPVTAVQEKLNDIVDQIKTRREEEKKTRNRTIIPWHPNYNREFLKLEEKHKRRTNHNLDTSDIQFLEDAGNNVEVDKSLFQEMDDLELEDDEDDPDYNPADPERDLAD